MIGKRYLSTNSFCPCDRAGSKRNLELKGEIMMNVEMKNGKIVITIDAEKKPKPSASGKTLVVASSHGNQATSVQIDSKPLVVGVNAYIKA